MQDVLLREEQLAAARADVHRLAINSPRLVPVTQVSHASAERFCWSTTRRVCLALACLMPREATFLAFAFETVGAMFLTLVTRVWATEVLMTRPRASVPTTKSPPMTGRPR